MNSPAGGATPGGGTDAAAGSTVPTMGRGVEYRCGDCGTKTVIKGGDPVRCRQCGFRILYKTRTKRCKLFLLKNRFGSQVWCHGGVVGRLHLICTLFHFIFFEPSDPIWSTMTKTTHATIENDVLSLRQENPLLEFIHIFHALPLLETQKFDVMNRKGISRCFWERKTTRGRLFKR